MLPEERFDEFPLEEVREVLRCARDPELLRDLEELLRELDDLPREVLRWDPEELPRDLEDLLRAVLRCEPEELLRRELLLLPLLFDELLRGGTLSPSRRASERPMAMACFGLVTFLPLRPILSLPCFISCISSWTFSCAFRPYFLPPEDLLDEDLLFVAIRRSPFPDWEAAQDEEVARRDA